EESVTLKLSEGALSTVLLNLNWGTSPSKLNKQPITKILLTDLK
ncbi:unnamed protein product, partial [Allacma fusca]